MSKPETAEAIRKAITMVTDHTARPDELVEPRHRLPPGYGDRIAP